MGSRLLNGVLRSLRGSNLEVFKFGMYLMFPIGWMYYFGTNLDERFKVPDFWPTQEQSHKLPYEKEDIKAEVQRLRGEMRARVERQRREDTDAAFRSVQESVDRRNLEGTGSDE